MSQPEYRAVVCGGRDYNNYGRVRLALDPLLQAATNAGYSLVIVSGGAKGADKLGELWAQRRGVTLRVVPADWDAHGKQAGFIRNRQMAEIAHLVVAFWDQKSKGTANMIDEANRRKLLLWLYTYGDPA